MPTFERYRGRRYKHQANPLLVEAYESGWVHSLDFEGILEFYGILLPEVIPNLTEADQAYMGCCDRYYLLVGILDRADALHPWLYARCREVEAEPDGCLDLWARDHYKSTIITYSGIIQEIINDPEVTIGIFSHTKSISTAFSLQIRREFENNERFRTIYEDICWRRTSQAKTWTQAAWTVRRESNPKEATVEAHGLVDGQPTSRHFKHLVYDDVVTLESVNTPEQIKKTTEAWELSDNLGSKGDRRWHIGTRYHFGDTYGVIIERGIVKVRKYPATHNGKPDGKPVFLDAATWERKKRTQRTTLAAQMLQNPLADKEQTFLPEWLTAYELRPATLNVYIMADPSRGAHRTSDRTAMAVIGIDAAGNKYLLDGFCHRMKLSEKWTNLRHLHKKWSQMPGVAFVKVGYERYGQISDDQYFEEQMRREGYHFPLEELAWPREGGHSKRERVERLQPDFEYGSFFLPTLVWVQGEGVCTWRYDEEQQLIAYQRVERNAAGQPKPTALIRRLRERGQGYLEAKPIRRINEDGDPYDVTRILMEEMSFFPFATRDDFVDACSRIYDMEPMAARPFEQMPELPATEDA